jgi:hypothetical protein
MRSRPRRPLICYLKYLKQNLVFMWGLHKFHFLFEIKYFMWGLGFYSHVKNTCHYDIIFTKRVRRVAKLVCYRAGCRLGDPWGIYEFVRLDPVCCLWSVYSKPGRLCIRCGVFDSVPTIFLLEFGTVPTRFWVFPAFLKRFFFYSRISTDSGQSFTIGSNFHDILGIIKCFHIKLHLKTYTEISFIYFF